MADFTDELGRALAAPTNVVEKCRYVVEVLDCAVPQEKDLSFPSRQNENLALN